LTLPSKVLFIDLSKRAFHIESRPSLFKEYLGGTGVATSLLLDHCPKNADPLGPENPIILTVGPLTGLYPLASKTVAMFKSPPTGTLGESHAGGRSAVAIRSAGYGAIIIVGSSETPVYLAIHGDSVNFRDASGIWGIVHSVTVGRVVRELEPYSGMRTVMRIGGAGENLVSYACVTTETYRHFGRLGLGAVFGSKKLKALVVSGNESIEVYDRKKYRVIYNEIYRKAVDSPVMKKYHDIGTAVNVSPLNELRAIPVMNLKRPFSPEVEEISGEKLVEGYLGRRVACTHCPVACVHIATLREPYEREPYFYKTSMISYDYEPVYSLGSMLGIFEIQGFLKLMDAVEAWGLDAMSLGVALAWATEAFEKGLITEKESLGLKFRWGDYQTYIKAVELVASSSTDFYKSLGKGVEYVSSIYGGENFALSFGSNEMAGYHTGPLCYVNYLTGMRHSHLDSAGYSLDQRMLNKGELLNPEEAAVQLYNEETWRQILSSLVVCFFARGIYDSETISNSLEAIGILIDEQRMLELGAEIVKKKLEFKYREGFSPQNFRIPKRILETESPHGRINEEYIRETIMAYYTLINLGKLRGHD
jgi:aldehyde:ferredoxin oxidoreductase